MLKLGVVTRAGVRHPRTLLGRRRHVSLLLLPELVTRADVDAEEYDRLVGYARMPNGVWKRTRHGRLHVVDAVLVDLLRERHADGSHLTVLDLAASTGVTSVELYRTLSAHFAVELVASDLYRDVVAVRSRHWPAAVVFDAFGEPLQYVLGRFVMPAGFAESPVYVVNRALRRLMHRWFAPAARGALAASRSASLAPFVPTTVGRFDVVKFPLLARETLEMIACEPRFRFEVADILRPLSPPAHVVRAMNILTRDHFGDAERVRALHHCIDAVRPGGLFVVGWSPTPAAETVEASVYSVEGGGLRRLVTLNGGSEIDTLIARELPVIEERGQLLEPRVSRGG
jgi:hypothetical protein